MKLLVAKQVANPGFRDFDFVPDGEIVHEGIIVCCNSDYCGCSRAFAGVLTHKGTTTAEVAEIPMTESELDAIAALSGDKSGWGELIRARMQSTIDAIAGLPVGTLVRAEYDIDNETWVYQVGEE